MCIILSAELLGGFVQNSKYHGHLNYKNVIYVNYSLVLHVAKKDFFYHILMPFTKKNTFEVFPLIWNVMKIYPVFSPIIYEYRCIHYTIYRLLQNFSSLWLEGEALPILIYSKAASVALISIVPLWNAMNFLINIVFYKET